VAVTGGLIDGVALAEDGTVLLAMGKRDDMALCGEA
jgi:hypothetical protein